jgi:two-component system, OmpR family, response regulator
MEPTRPLSVLVVDDEPDAVWSTVELLTLNGFQARGAVGGRAALDAAADCPPDVVLLDLTMPGVDGYEVARRLHEDLRRPPIVIAVTAVAEAVGGPRAQAGGFHLYLTKPVPPAELLDVVGLCERAVAWGGDSTDSTTIPNR